jgi:CcmD family protein
MRSLILAVLLIISMIIPAYQLSTNNAAALHAQTKETKKIETVKPHKDSKIFKVMIIIMIIWLGIGGYIFTIDRKVKKLENDINEL